MKSLKTKNPIGFVIFLVFIFFALIAFGQNKAWEVPKKYKRMSNPYADEKSDDFIGRAVYKKRCFSCHGNSGQGNGSKASSLDTKVGSLADSEFQSHTDGEIYYKIIFGKDHMPSFEKDIEDEEDRWQLVNYLRSFKK